MSDPSATGSENTGSPKKKVSPARNVIGFVGLIVLIVIAAFQYSAVLGYNAALKAIEARSQDEDKGLVDVPETEKILGKAPDGPGSDFSEGNRTFTKTPYTWRGAIKSYTLTVYYTKGPGTFLHHYEPDGEKYTPEPVVDVNSTPIANPGMERTKKKKAAPADEKAKATAAPADEKSKAAPPADVKTKAAPPPAAEPSKAGETAPDAKAPK